MDENEQTTKVGKGKQDEDNNPIPLSITSGWRTLRVYQNAFLWSAFMGLAGINWGLDVMLSTGVIAVPAFAEDFGYIFENNYIISASWLVAFNTASSVGGVLGALLSGYLSDVIGKRKTMGLACLLSIGSVFMQFFAPNSEVLLVGKLLNGLCLGFFISIPTAYAAEICPVHVRGFTTSSMQLYLGLGQLIGSVALKGTGTLNSAWAYKIPFALQFVFPVFLLIGLPFCPESPWFLIRADKSTEAIACLSRLGYPSPEETAAELASTILHEDTESSKATYVDCFRGSDLRRTEIAMGIVAVAQFTGIIFVVGYSTYFFQLAGIATAASFSLSVGVSVLSLVGVIGSWFLINRAGRRQMTLVGVCVITILLFLIGILDVVPGNRVTPVYGQVACIIIFAFMYHLTIGPTTYTLLSEISSTRLRSRTVGLGIVVQSVTGILLNIVIPLMINPDAGNWKGKLGFVFGGTALMSCIWVFLRVPETKARGFRELDSMFEMGVGARKFKEYSVT